MNRQTNSIYVLVVALLFLSVWGTASAGAASGEEQRFNPVAEEMINSSGISWSPKVSYEQIILSLSRPDGTVYKKTFNGGTSPYIDLSNIIGNSGGDGAYTYELRVISQRANKVRSDEGQGLTKKHWQKESMPISQTGHFMVHYGSIVSKNFSERPSRALDVVHTDDEIVTGGLCVGPDCKTDGSENFGTDTIKLKSNNLRLFFDDTSIEAGYAANDWRIFANDPASGGGNYFAIQDATATTKPFTIEAGAPESSLYLDDYGRLGLGTAVPGAALHIINNDSPNLRLEQDASGGFTAQTWDIQGNDSSFSVRDISHESKLPFRIQPNAPSDTLCLKNNGNVGIGTWSPGYPFELNTTDRNAALVVKRINGAANFMNATATHSQFGSITPHPVRILVNTIWKFMLNLDGSITMASGATCTAGGVWTNASSRTLKENIHVLTTPEAIHTLNNLNPVKYNYKADKTEKHVGFIAEDVPELVASQDRKGLSPMDVVAVLTKVVQEQQKTLLEQQKFLQEQQQMINQLKEKIERLEKK